MPDGADRARASPTGGRLDAGQKAQPQKGADPLRTNCEETDPALLWKWYIQLTQAEGALPDTRAQLEAIAEQLMRVRRQIALLGGQTPSALDELSPRLDALTLDTTPATLGADLLARRPDLVAARWRVESALHDIAVSQTRFYPNINLGAFVGLSALGLDKLLQAGSLQAGLSPALHLPLFDAGRLRAQLGARQAELDLALAQYNAAVVEAVKQAGDAIGSEQSLQRQQREQEHARQQPLPPPERRRDLANACSHAHIMRFEAGRCMAVICRRSQSR